MTSSGRSAGEYPGQVGGVGEPLGVGPVRLVDAVLDLFGAVAVVEEAVEGDDFEAAPVEFAAQAAQGGGVDDQGAGRVPGQPQADAEAVAAEASAYGFAVVAELGENAVDGFGGVDVGAVGEVDGGAVGVAEAHRSLPAAQDGVALAAGEGAVGRRGAWAGVGLGHVGAPFGRGGGVARERGGRGRRRAEVRRPPPVAAQWPVAAAPGSPVRSRVVP